MPVLRPPKAPSTPAPPLDRGPTRVRHPRLAGGIAVMVGTAATGAGAGLGFRHLQKTGVSVQTVLGLVALATGLVLIGHAARSAWRALRRWRRCWLIPAALAVLAATTSVALAVMYAVIPPTRLGPATPADREMSFTDVAFPSSGGAVLSAWYVPPRSGAAIVLRHGAGSTRSGTLAQAAVLARHGYGLLLVDARGHGRSTGRGMDVGWYGDADITAAVSFLARQPGVDPGRIGVLGLSMGGEEAIGSAAADRRIRAVVAEGATGRTAEDKARWLPRGVNGAVQRGLDRLTYALTDLLTPASPPRTLHDAITRATQTPFLLIAAGRRPDETRAAADLKSAAPGRVQTWTVDSAGHTGGLSTDASGWGSRVVAFFDAHLAPSSR